MYKNNEATLDIFEKHLAVPSEVSCPKCNIKCVIMNLLRDQSAWRHIYYLLDKFKNSNIYDKTIYGFHTGLNRYLYIGGSIGSIKNKRYLLEAPVKNCVRRGLIDDVIKL